MNTKQLRQKILDLAIRGKLVPQDPNDEPASVLLERIRAEKEKLIKEGKIRRDKNISTTPRSDDKSHYGQFEIPNSWAWVQLGDICNLSNGIAKRKGDKGKSIIVLRLADLTGEAINLSSAREIILTDLEVEQYQLKNRDLVFVRVNGSKPNVGKSYVYNHNFVISFCDHLMRGRVNEKVDSNYIRLAMRSTDCRKHIDNLIVTTAGQNTINQGSLSSTVFPLPPLAEQRRIVTAIESAFAVIDEIEAAKNDLQTSVATIKQKILSLAIRGKLVPQDPNDEPAAVLLERIRTEKDLLSKAGKIKRSKSEKAAPASVDNSYYGNLPGGWCIMPIGKLFDIVGGGTPATSISEYWGDGIPWFSSADIDESGNVTPRRCVTRTGIEHSATNVVPARSVIIVTRVGLGKVAILDTEMCFSQDNQALIPIYPGAINSHFLFHLLLHEMQTLKFSGRGTTISGITKKQLADVNLWIPPIAEQSRIVAALESAYTQYDEISETLS